MTINPNHLCDLARDILELPVELHLSPMPDERLLIILDCSGIRIQRELSVYGLTSDLATSAVESCVESLAFDMQDALEFHDEEES